MLDMLTGNRFEEAEKQLDGFKPSNRYEAGYLKGLRGILQSLRKPAEGSVIGETRDNLEKHLKSILESVETHYLSQEEEGYFTAWIDYLRKLSGGE